jgi:hypothetical protein
MSQEPYAPGLKLHHQEIVLNDELCVRAQMCVFDRANRMATYRVETALCTGIPAGSCLPLRRPRFAGGIIPADTRRTVSDRNKRLTIGSFFRCHLSREQRLP